MCARSTHRRRNLPKVLRRGYFGRKHRGPALRSARTPRCMTRVMACGEDFDGSCEASRALPRSDQGWKMVGAFVLNFAALWSVTREPDVCLSTQEGKPHRTGGRHVWYRRGQHHGRSHRNRLCGRSDRRSGDRAWRHRQEPVHDAGAHGEDRLPTGTGDPGPSSSCRRRAPRVGILMQRRRDGVRRETCSKRTATRAGRRGATLPHPRKASRPGYRSLSPEGASRLPAFLRWNAGRICPSSDFGSRWNWDRRTGLLEDGSERRSVRVPANHPRRLDGPTHSQPMRSGISGDAKFNSMSMSALTFYVTGAWKNEDMENIMPKLIRFKNQCANDTTLSVAQLSGHCSYRFSQNSFKTDMVRNRTLM